MRRTNWWSIAPLAASAVAALSSGRAAAQGLSDVHPVKPLMMLLVDTSGSMENLPDTASCVNCTPNCSNSAADSTQRNRWAYTVEALTGTFNDFRCTSKARSSYSGAFDQHYYLPHYELSGSSQASDGVLDSYKHQLKFGLMTFDGVATTVNGATLIAQSIYQSDSSFKSSVLGRDGMYSYPDSYAALDPSAESSNGYGWKPLSFPGCSAVYGVNVGARGKGAATDYGSLISVGVSDSGSDVTAINDQIQTSLRNVRPYGGTPIAGMLDDLSYYLTHDADVKRGGDPYYTCRKRFAVLLTDGAPDELFRDARFKCNSTNDGACAGGACQCPYDTPDNLATRLVRDDGLDALWVVAFNVNDSSAVSQLNEIARDGSPDRRDAFLAPTPSALRQALHQIMGLTAPDATSRSVPAIVNSGKAVLLGGKQYEITAGFRVGNSDDEPWQGLLFRRRIGCGDNASVVSHTLTASEGDMFHVTLNSRSASDRNLLTSAPTVAGMRGSLYTADSNAIDSSAFSGTKLNIARPDGTQFSTTLLSDDGTATASQAVSEDNVTVRAFDESTSALYFGDVNGNGLPGEAADRDAISDYVRGESSNRRERKLGDIYHSNPVVLPPLATGSDELNAFDPLLRTFYLNVIDPASGSYPKGHYGASHGRPGVVFVGTNDGVLHAFNLDTWQDKSGTTYGPGYEFWGFVPAALFDKMAATAAPSHQYMFDGTPVVKDVIYKRGLTSGSVSMGTVLIAAVRGAPAFVALDVTYPEQPKILWQRSFPYLGNTLGTPAIAHVKLDWNGEPQIRAVAILPGGEGVASTGACDVNQLSRGKAPGGRDQVRCWKLRGRALYVVDVATGELVQEFDARHFHSPLTGAVAVDGQELSRSQAAYFTDEDGVLWQLSMLNTDPSRWRVSPVWDLFAGTATGFDGNTASVPTPSYKSGRVAMYPPLLARDPSSGNWTIVVGTGDVDNLVDNVPHRVVSLAEARRVDSSGELASTFSANWTLQLETGESVTGPLTLYDETLYFASFRSPVGGSGDMCDIGTSRLVGAHVRKKQTSNLPLPMLLPEDGVPPLVLEYAPDDAENSLLLGLSVARQPVCMVGTAENDPLNSGSPLRFKQTGNSGGGAFQVRSLIAGQGGAVIPGSGDLRQLERTLPIPNIARSVGWASSIE